MKDMDLHRPSFPGWTKKGQRATWRQLCPGFYLGWGIPLLDIDAWQSTAFTKQEGRHQGDFYTDICL
jgi:hypothetical protein